MQCINVLPPTEVICHIRDIYMRRHEYAFSQNQHSRQEVGTPAPHYPPSETYTQFFTQAFLPPALLNEHLHHQNTIEREGEEEAAFSHVGRKVCVGKVCACVRGEGGGGGDRG